MAESGSGLLDLGRELTCQICTDIFYQPLTLLDCLHTFCGSCLREWFAFQAASARNSNGNPNTNSSRRAEHPYTCPSCRDSVRGTKADWRLTTLLEGFLKANPAQGKTEAEKEEMRQHYKPGDNVLPPVALNEADSDSEDERLMADVRELSMANVDPDTARRRAERRSRERQTRRRERRINPQSRNVEATRQRSEEERHIEHQPSLRSLLSGSEISSENVQEEILQLLQSEGLLSGIDLDNLTAQQEEELTERIADAYRRRQRDRERPRDHAEPRSRERDSANTRSPGSSTIPAQVPSHSQPRPDSSSSAQQQQLRSRPPISRPHLFEHPTSGAARSQRRRSASSSSHHRQLTGDFSSLSPATRSSTNLTQDTSSDDIERQQRRPRAVSSNARSITDPASIRTDIQTVWNVSENSRPGTSDTRARSHGSGSREPPTSTSTSSPPPPESTVLQVAPPVRTTSAFAPEVVSDSRQVAPHMAKPPSVSCSRCGKQSIEMKIHYHCFKCDSGSFNLCQQCYRTGQGCHHWFGFGFDAAASWHRAAPPQGWPPGYEYPHILIARRYTANPQGLPPTPEPNSRPSSSNSSKPPVLQEGPFCESCGAFASDCYWHCQTCLHGAWGFCDTCVLQGRHCTHPLLPIRHISKYYPQTIPSNIEFVPAPHLQPSSYILLPVLADCNLCRIPIPPPDPRFHCFACCAGDYDVCAQCYHALCNPSSTTGGGAAKSPRISPSNGPAGWRRCPQNHRLAVVRYRLTPGRAAQFRLLSRGPVGGWRLKAEEDSLTSPPPPELLPAEELQARGEFGATAAADAGVRYEALYSWFPADPGRDDLVFPLGAEIREVEEKNADWAVGVYTGAVGVFPRNHGRRVGGR